MSSTPTIVKRVLLGRPRPSGEAGRQHLTKRLAFPLFSSDQLSSVAYASQEMMLVLAVAGVGAFVLLQPLGAAVALLLVVVAVGMGQVVRLYPGDGGAYSAARANLGPTAGLLTAGALLVDYVLTVAVSVAAGAAAITSAIPALDGRQVGVALALVLLVAVIHLRGMREAGALVAVPAYAFVLTMFALIATGVARCAGGCPPAESAGTTLSPETGLTVLLAVRAFAVGATALTGLEAIPNGLTAFRYPQSRNAAVVLAAMTGIGALLFLGIGYLAVGTGVVAHDGMERTVTAQIALAVFGPGAGFYLVQTVTAAILVLAANTAFAVFPRLTSALAADRFLPSQFRVRGDRLVFSNGVIALAVAAGALLVLSGADVTMLVQLYVVSVFAALTLAMSGMARHWLRQRERGWRRWLALHVSGAVVCAGVFAVVAAAGFDDGTWAVVLAALALGSMMHGIRRHYRGVSLALRAAVAESEPTRPLHMVILLDRVDESAARALSYARAARPTSLVALGVPRPGADLERRWYDLAPDVTVRVLQPAGSRRTVAVLRAALQEQADRNGEGFTNAVVPETLSRSWLDLVRHHHLALRVKASLLQQGRVVVTDLTSPEGGPGPYTVEEPAEHHVVVLVSAVHKPTMRAIAYAQSLQATSLRALSINLHSERTRAILQSWDDWGVQIPLELLDSPFRNLTGTLREYLREFAPDGRQVIVTCVLPEFILRRWYVQPLHNQTALLIKGALVFERGVVTTSVPYDLTPSPEAAAWARAADQDR